MTNINDVHKNLPTFQALYSAQKSAMYYTLYCEVAHINAPKFQASASRKSWTAKTEKMHVTMTRITSADMTGNKAAEHAESDERGRR